MLVIVVLVALAPAKITWNPASVVPLALPSSFWMPPLETVVAPDRAAWQDVLVAGAGEHRAVGDGSGENDLEAAERRAADRADIVLDGAAGDVGAADCAAGIDILVAAAGER